MMDLTPSTKPNSQALLSNDTSAQLAPSSEFSFTVTPLPGEKATEMFRRLAVALKDSDTTLLSLMVFGSIRMHLEVDQAMRRTFDRIEWPVTWVEGAARDDQPIAGMHACALRAGQTSPIMLNGRVVGSVFEEGGMRQCLLGGLGPSRSSASCLDQFRQTLENVDTALSRAGFSLGDVVRTWFYLDQLLSWYPEFNRARTESYSRIIFRTGSLPASTAVSARNPDGTALVAAAWALQPLNAAVRVAAVPSPMQCTAPAYGSSFSRAMEISSLHGRRLLISGTASVALDGRTLWPRKLRRQIQRTMKVVETILASRGFGFSDVTRAIAYFKNRSDISEFSTWCNAHNVPSLPVIAVQCGICRDDLLFELEVDTWNSSSADCLNRMGADMAELSPREREVLELLARGAAYKEIASRLSLSIETIRMHVKHIYAKLHVHSRGEATAKYFSRLS